MIALRALLLCLVTAAVPLRGAADLPNVVLRGGRLFAGDQALIVHGVGYSPWAPANVRDQADALMEEDFRRMRRFGLNLIKGWGPTSPDLLDRCERNSIYALSAVLANSEYPVRDHAAFVASKLREIETEMLPCDGRSAILAWNLGSELHDGDWRARSPEIADYLRQALELFHRRSRRPVTYGNLMGAVDDLDLSALGIYGIQVYLFSRPRLRQFLAHVRERLAPGQPLLVTEFGTSSCPAPARVAEWGRVPIDQGLGYEMQWQEIMRAGALGGVFFEWNDEWYKGEPGNDPEVQDAHSEEHFGLVEAGRRPKPAAAHVARMLGAIRVVREPRKLVIPREATLIVGPKATPIEEATTEQFHLTVAEYLPQALPKWTVRHDDALDRKTAVIVPGREMVQSRSPQTARGTGLYHFPAHAPAPGEGVILGGADESRPTLLAGGDGFGLLAAFDRYLGRWRSDPTYRRTHVTVFGGGVLAYLPTHRYFIDFGPDEETEVVAIEQLFIGKGEDPSYLADHVRRGGGLFVVGGWGTYTGYEGASTRWKSTALEDVLPVTLGSGPDTVNLAAGQGLQPQIVRPDHPLARALAGFPTIYGYNAERPRPGAQVIMALPDGRPILVTGRYGRGRVLCLLTGISPGWGAEVAKWPGVGHFVRSCLEWAQGTGKPH